MGKGGLWFVFDGLYSLTVASKALEDFEDLLYIFLLLAINIAISNTALGNGISIVL